MANETLDETVPNRTTPSSQLCAFIPGFGSHWLADCDGRNQWYRLCLGCVAGRCYYQQVGRKNKRAYGLLSTFAMLIGAPCFYLSLHIKQIWLSRALLTVLLFTSGTYLGSSFALAQALAPVKVRAMSTALFFFVLNIIAWAAGRRPSVYSVNIWPKILGKWVR